MKNAIASAGVIALIAIAITRGPTPLAIAIALPLTALLAAESIHLYRTWRAL